MWKGCQWGGIGVAIGASMGLVTTNGHVGWSQVRSWHPSRKYGQPRGHGQGAVGLVATCKTRLLSRAISKM